MSDCRLLPQVQIGILASNSNEVKMWRWNENFLPSVHLQGCSAPCAGPQAERTNSGCARTNTGRLINTSNSSVKATWTWREAFALQASSVLPQLLLNWNPQLAAPFNPQFFPNQASQLTPVLPPNGQEQQPQEPNAANGPQTPLNPVQVRKTAPASSCYSVIMCDTAI